MNRLREAILKLAEAFADGVLDAVHAATVEEILSGERIARKPPLPPPPRTIPRPSRATATKRRGQRAALGAGSGTNDAVVAALLGVLAKEPNGVRSEELRAKLGVDRKAMTTAVAYTLSTQQVRKTGSRRSTTYHIVATKPASIAPAPAAPPIPP